MQTHLSIARDPERRIGIFASGVVCFVKSSRIRVNVRFSGTDDRPNVRLGATGWRACVGLGLRDFLRQINENCAHPQRV
jgi:hypothetical protein